MFFAVMKITFAVDETNAGQDVTSLRHDLQSLTEKLRSRFRIAVLPQQVESAGDTPVIGVASLAHSEEALSRQLDAICEFCESSGFGRIETERTLLDHVDSFGDDDDDLMDEDDDDFDRSH